MAGSADPLVNFQRFASGLLSNPPSNVAVSSLPTAIASGVFPPSALDSYYYSSYNSLQQLAAAAGGSSPSPSAHGGGEKKETVLSSRTISFITLQLRRVLSRMKIRYKDLATSPLDGGAGDDSAGNSRRVSLESDDGTKVEIGVSPAENVFGMNKVDFRCVEGNYDRYQELCSAVLAGLNL